MKSGSLEERQKTYEQAEAGRKFIPLIPVCARLDGKSFHNFTKGLERPYSANFRKLMTETTKYLVQNTQAAMGYTQSDEISLVWYSGIYKSEIFFNGKIHKMTSILASMATCFFNKNMLSYLPEKTDNEALFDCRVWQVPTLAEAANMFLWRENDATRNSIEAAAQYFYPSKLLHKKHLSTLMELIMQAGVNWNDYPDYFKRGTYVQKRIVTRKYTTIEIDKLPPKHEARSNPDLMVERTTYQALEMPPFSKVLNRIEVVFYGAEPDTNDKNIMEETIQQGV